MLKLEKLVILYLALTAQFVGISCLLEMNNREQSRSKSEKSAADCNEWLNDFSIFNDESERFRCVGVCWEKESLGSCCHHVVVSRPFPSSESSFGSMVISPPFSPSLALRSFQLVGSVSSLYLPPEILYPRPLILFTLPNLSAFLSSVSARGNIYLKLFVDQRQRESWKTINIIAEQLNGPSIKSSAPKVRTLFRWWTLNGGGGGSFDVIIFGDPEVLLRFYRSMSVSEWGSSYCSMTTKWIPFPGRTFLYKYLVCISVTYERVGIQELPIVRWV